jgi:hypothetical protein
VEITGTASTSKPAVSIATLLVNVAQVSPKSTGGCLSVAQNLGAQTEATNAAVTPVESTTQPVKTGGGMSTGAKIAIIVAVAGGGAGAAIALAGKKSSTSP